MRVLVAEDVATNRLVARNLLRGFGCSVAFAEDGLQALEAVARNACDLVLMDVAMPVMDGLEATRRIRGLAAPGRDVAIVGVTASAQPEERRRCLEAGMDQVVGKPLRREVLEEILRSATTLRPPAPGAGATTGVLDAGHFGELLEGLAPAQVAEVLERVAQDLRNHARAALEAVDAGDVRALASACHVLKGLAASFGMHELARLSREIEQHCRSGDREAAMAAALSGLARAAGAAQAAVESFSPRPAEQPL